jgi:signal transduction histidine kinase
VPAVSGGGPVPGRVEAEFLGAVGRFAGRARGAVLCLIGVFGVLATPAGALPLGVALLGLTAAVAVAELRTAKTGRGARTTLGLVVARTAVICAAGAWTAPEPGEPNQWAVNALTITALTLQWEWPPPVTVPITAGLLVVDLLPIDAEQAVFTTARVLVECVLARLVFVVLLRTTREVDALRERRAALEREELLLRARRRQEREYLALLHDTASATFLVVAAHGRAADPAEVAEYARRDLAVLTGSSHGAQDGLVDAGESLRALVRQSRLPVDARWEPVPLLPASVALALVRAVGEALTNVERHAGACAVRLGVEARDTGVVVTLTDTGPGFDPDDVPRHRRGIRDSVVERMAAVGGGAAVTSARGRGTTVRLVWPG